MEKVQMMPLSALVPYTKNPRKNDEGVKAVASSIREFGFRNPIIVDRDNVIIAGHTRYKAAEMLGLQEVPVIVADDLTQDQASALRIADNKTAELSKWDHPLLSDELSQLNDKFDFTTLGFSKSELDQLLDRASGENDGFLMGDPQDTRVHRGETWILGDHRLRCGDSTDADDVAALMGGVKTASADLIVTDPPYNVDYHGGGRMDRDGIANDNMSDPAFREFLSAAFRAADTVLKSGAAIYIWHSGKSVRAFVDSAESVGWDVRQTLIWVKNHFVLGRSDYQTAHEPCLYCIKPGAPRFFRIERNKSTVSELPDLESMSKDEILTWIKNETGSDDKNPKDVLRASKPNKSKEHPTMKPVELFADHIKNSSLPGWIVLDMFGGSGTTLIACEQLGRKARLMEFEPKFCDVIIERWEKMTGKTAVQEVT